MKNETHTGVQAGQASAAPLPRRAALLGLGGLAAAAATLGAATGCVAQAGGGVQPTDPNLRAVDTLGMGLRVYRTGDMLTMDYRTDRLNIELGAGERIVRVWVG